jgi:pimeloyl-ACP methyl ester carboxylesterase
MSSAKTELRHGYADANGMRLHYASAGASGDPLMLFLHGFPEFWYAWRRQLAEFGRDRHAVAGDMRGYNLSSKPDGVDAYRTKHLVADVAGLIGALGHRSCVLVGHDWGGSVAWATAIARPDLVDQLIIVNAPHPGIFGRLLAGDADQQRASGYMLKYRGAGAEDYLTRDDCRELRTSIIELGISRGYFDDADGAAYLDAWRQPGAVAGMLNYYRAMQMAPPHRDGTPAQIPALDDGRLAVRVPTLVIWGMADRFLLPQNLDGLEDYVSDLRVHRIADGTHWVIHEFPGEVNAAIRAFAG